MSRRFPHKPALSTVCLNARTPKHMDEAPFNQHSRRAHTHSLHMESSACASRLKSALADLECLTHVDRDEPHIRTCEQPYCMRSYAERGYERWPV